MRKDSFKFRLTGILIAIAVIAGFSVVAMLLWNALMPGIFGLPPLNYWQAAGILVLARILFGGLGPGHFVPYRRSGFGERDFYHGNKLREKWMKMSAEERKAFAEKEKDFRTMFYDRFSHFHQFDKETETNNKKADSPSKGDDNE